MLIHTENKYDMKDLLMVGEKRDFYPIYAEPITKPLNFTKSNNYYFEIFIRNLLRLHQNINY